MKNLIEGGVKGLLAISYWVVAILQFFGIYALFSDVWDWNWFFAFFAALITCGIPVLGTILGVYGAHEGWGWSWLASLALYLWPFILVAVFGLCSFLFGKR